MVRCHQHYTTEGEIIDIKLISYYICIYNQKLLSYIYITFVSIETFQLLPISCVKVVHWRFEGIFMVQIFFNFYTSFCNLCELWISSLCCWCIHIVLNTLYHFIIQLHRKPGEQKTRWRKSWNVKHCFDLAALVCKN